MLHKISDAMNPVAPTPERVETELIGLESWLNDVEGRQKNDPNFLIDQGHVAFNNYYRRQFFRR
ncbi:MAG: hypothetical protein ABJP13_00085 [Sulfitobacter sp.]|uniref:hypothetical protein n=2 Tax=Sulfitobacter sp. TaxID=1903071 RepID=UPI0032984104